MNVLVHPDHVAITRPEVNVRGIKVITQIRDQAYGDNEWHDLVYEILNPNTDYTTKQLNENQRVVLEII